MNCLTEYSKSLEQRPSTVPDFRLGGFFSRVFLLFILLHRGATVAFPEKLLRLQIQVGLEKIRHGKIHKNIASPPLLDGEER